MVGSEADTIKLYTEFGINAEYPLLCWQNGLLNLYRVVTRTSDYYSHPNLVFVTAEGLNHTYFVYNGKSYNIGVTWNSRDFGNIDISVQELGFFMANNGAFEITEVCVNSQIDYMGGDAGDPYWSPIKDLDRRLGLPEEYLIALSQQILKPNHFRSFEERYY